MLKVIVLALLILIVGAMAYVRLVPIPQGAYFALPQVDGPSDIEGGRSFTAVRQITTTPDGILRAVEAAANNTPRTKLIEGSVDQNRLVFVTRSLIWGFPDFTTVGIEDGALIIHGRARFGQSDLGVNKGRVEDWLAQLGPLVAPPS